MNEPSNSWGDMLSKIVLEIIMMIFCLCLIFSCSRNKDIVAVGLERYHFKKHSCKDSNDSLLFHFPEYLTDTISNPLWVDFDQERNMKWDLMSHRAYIDGISIRRAYIIGDSVNVISYRDNKVSSKTTYPVTKPDSFFLDIAPHCEFYYSQSNLNQSDLGHETHLLKNRGELVGILIITNGTVIHSSELNTDNFDNPFFGSCSDC